MVRATRDVWDTLEVLIWLFRGLNEPPEQSYCSYIPGQSYMFYLSFKVDPEHHQ